MTFAGLLQTSNISENNKDGQNGSSKITSLVNLECNMEIKSKVIFRAVLFKVMEFIYYLMSNFGITCS